MTLLEAESTGDGTPQGVVLALVGPPTDSPKEQESVKAIRMYNLAGLASLAKWAMVQTVSILTCSRHSFPASASNMSTARCVTVTSRLGRGWKGLDGKAPQVEAEPCEGPEKSQTRQWWTFVRPWQ